MTDNQVKTENRDELKELCSLSGAAGHEDRVIAYLKEKLSGLTDDLSVDFTGNIAAGFTGTHEPETRLLIIAHMDEVGMLVRKISDDGYLFFERLGGPSEKTLRSQIVDVFSLDEQSSCKGVIGTKSHHFTGDSEKHSVPNKHELYIDIGASSKQEVLEKGIDIGSVVTYSANYTRVGQHRVVSKTLDNRAACFALLQTARFLKKRAPRISVTLGFSVQEEFHLRGSLPLWEKVRPDFVISLDCCVACDTPDLKNLYEISLGKGPAVSHMSCYGKGPAGGLLPNPKFRTFIEQTALSEGIPFQREVVAGVLSDASFMSMKGADGTICAHIGFPMRYSHSPAEEADLRDIESLIRLLCAVSADLGQKEQFRRG